MMSTETSWEWVYDPQASKIELEKIDKEYDRMNAKFIEAAETKSTCVAGLTTLKVLIKSTEDKKQELKQKEALMKNPLKRVDLSLISGGGTTKKDLAVTKKK